MEREYLNRKFHYSAQPLPESLLRELPAMIVGERIAAIRQRRRLTKVQLRRMAGIASSTYAYVEKRDGLPDPKHLFNISKVLQVDPILIIKGKNWNLASRLLPNNEKMSLLRLRKGWSQKEMAIALEKAGLNFRTTILYSKRARIAQWEIGAAEPPHSVQEIIKKVLEDNALFSVNKRTEIALEHIKDLSSPKNKGNSGFLRLRVRVIRLIISDLKATGVIRDAKTLEASLNRKLAEIAKGGECLSQGA